jgi:putative redox protein
MGWNMADIEAVGDLVGDTIIVDETKLAAFQLKVTAGASTFLVDEPVAAGGAGTGPNPYDLLSAAIGSCSLMTMRLYANRKHWPLQSVRVKVTHRRSRLEARDTFVKEIQLTGPLDDAQRARILEISTHCPVHTTIERGSEIQTVLLPHDSMDDKPVSCYGHVRDMNEACAK